MIKQLTKLFAFVISFQTAFAAPTAAETLARQEILIKEVKSLYDASAKELPQKGLNAFVQAYPAGTFSELDRAFLATKIKGLTKLPAVSSPKPGVIAIENKVKGVSQPVLIEFADASGKRFKVAGQIIQVEENDGLEGVYKKVSAVLPLHVSQRTLWQQVSDAVVPQAHAFEVSKGMLIGGGLVAVGVAIMIYMFGKKKGKTEAEAEHEKKREEARKRRDRINQTISEANPVHLVNPGTETSNSGTDHSSDVITPLTQ